MIVTQWQECLQEGNKITRLIIASDLHLGHKNICKYRTQFSTPEEHDEFVFNNIVNTIRKSDTLYLLGDIAFTKEWLQEIKSIKCRYKLLICGNHDTERNITMSDLVQTYDNVKALLSHRNYWFTHCPIHPQEIRGRLGVIHGHLHSHIVEDDRYYNACLEHTDYKPIEFEELIKRELYV